MSKEEGCEELLGTDIAIDLGTSSIKVYLDGKGIVLREPSVVAVNQDTDTVVAVGHEAYAMIGRTSDRINVVTPLFNGVIPILIWRVIWSRIIFVKSTAAKYLCRVWWSVFPAKSQRWKSELL